VLKNDSEISFKKYNFKLLFYFNFHFISETLILVLIFVKFLNLFYLIGPHVNENVIVHQYNYEIRCLMKWYRLAVLAVLRHLDVDN